MAEEVLDANNPSGNVSYPDPLKKLRRLHAAMREDSVFYDFAPESFDEFVSKYSNQKDFRELHSRLSSDEVFSKVVPADISQAASTFGLTPAPETMGKPSPATQISSERGGQMQGATSQSPLPSPSAKRTADDFAMAGASEPEFQFEESQEAAIAKDERRVEREIRSGVNQIDILLSAAGPKVRGLIEKGLTDGLRQSEYIQLMDAIPEQSMFKQYIGEMNPMTDVSQNQFRQIFAEGLTAGKFDKDFAPRTEVLGKKFGERLSEQANPESVNVWLSQFDDKQRDRIGAAEEQKVVAELSKKYGEPQARSYIQNLENVRSLSYIPEDERKTAELLREQTEILKKENPTSQEMQRAREIEVEVQRLREESDMGQTASLYNPVTGQFVSGNEITPEIQQFNQEVVDKQGEYERTPLELLKEMRRRAYFSMLAYKGKVDSQGLSSVSDWMWDFVPGDNTDVDNYRSALTDFMAINRAIELNVDPATVTRDGSFADAFVAGFANRPDDVGNTNRAFVTSVLNQFERNGITVTDAQKERLTSEFSEQLGQTLGTSANIMVKLAAEMIVSRGIKSALGIKKYATAIESVLKSTRLGRTSPKAARFLSRVIGNTADVIEQGVLFEGAGQGAATGMGEEFAQKLMDLVPGFNNRILRMVGGITGEVIGEYVGEFTELANKYGLGDGLNDAFRETFGRNPTEAWDKLLLTMAAVAPLSGTSALLGPKREFLEASRKAASAEAKRGNEVAQAIVDMATEALDEQGVFATPEVLAQEITAETEAAPAATETESAVAEVEAAPAATETAVAPEVAPRTVEDAISGSVQVERNGVRGNLILDGQTVVFEHSDGRVLEDVDNVDAIKGSSIADFGFQEVLRVEADVNPEDMSVTIDGVTYQNNYSNPDAAINYDSDGNVVSVTLDTQDGKKRTFRGERAQEIAYQYKLIDFEKNATEEQIESILQRAKQIEQTEGGAVQTPVTGEAETAKGDVATEGEVATEPVIQALENVESTAKSLDENAVSQIEERANMLFPKSENTNQVVSESYHAAKAKPEAERTEQDNELIAAVEEVLTPKTEADATKEGEQQQGSVPERAGVTKQEQGKGANRQDQEADVAQGEAASGGGDSATQGGKEQEVGTASPSQNVPNFESKGTPKAVSDRKAKLYATGLFKIKEGTRDELILNMDVVKERFPKAHSYLRKYRDITDKNIFDAISKMYSSLMKYKAGASNLLEQISEIEDIAQTISSNSRTYTKEEFKQQLKDSGDFSPKQLEIFYKLVDSVNYEFFPEYNSNEASLRLIGVDGSRSPNFYSLSSNVLSAKEPETFIHEIGHWAFYNVLSKEDRIRFIQYMIDTSYGEGAKSLAERLALTSEKIEAEVDGKKYEYITNVSDNFSEYFAEQFRQWYLGVKSTPSEIDTIFEKVASFLRSFVEKLKSGKFVDSNLNEYFDKIISINQSNKEAETTTGAKPTRNRKEDAKPGERVEEVEGSGVLAYERVSVNGKRLYYIKNGGERARQVSKQEYETQVAIILDNLNSSPDLGKVAQNPSEVETTPESAYVFDEPVVSVGNNLPASTIAVFEETSAPDADSDLAGEEESESEVTEETDEAVADVIEAHTNRTPDKIAADRREAEKKAKENLLKAWKKQAEALSGSGFDAVTQAKNQATAQIELYKAVAEYIAIWAKNRIDAGLDASYDAFYRTHQSMIGKLVADGKGLIKPANVNINSGIMMAAYNDGVDMATSVAAAPKYTDVTQIDAEYNQIKEASKKKFAEKARERRNAARAFFSKLDRAILDHKGPVKSYLRDLAARVKKRGVNFDTATLLRNMQFAIQTGSRLDLVMKRFQNDIYRGVGRKKNIRIPGYPEAMSMRDVLDMIIFHRTVISKDRAYEASRNNVEKFDSELRAAGFTDEEIKKITGGTYLTSGKVNQELATKINDYLQASGQTEPEFKKAARRRNLQQEHINRVGPAGHTHPFGTDLVKSQKAIDIFKQALGDASFAEISARADTYFEANRSLLRERLNSGEITQALYDEIIDRDYMPTVWDSSEIDAQFGESFREAGFDIVNQKGNSTLMYSYKGGSQTTSMAFTDSEKLLEMNAATTLKRINRSRLFNFIITNFLPAQDTDLAIAIEQREKQLGRKLNAKEQLEVRRKTVVMYELANLGVDKTGKPKFEKPIDNQYSTVVFTDSNGRSRAFAVAGIAKEMLDTKGAPTPSAIISMISNILGTTLIKSTAVGTNLGFAVGQIPMDTIHQLMVSPGYKFLPAAIPIKLAMVGVNIGQNLLYKSINQLRNLAAKVASGKATVNERNRYMERVADAVSHGLDYGGGLFGYKPLEAERYNNPVARDLNEVYQALLSVISTTELAVRMTTYDTLVRHFTRKIKRSAEGRNMTQAQIVTKAKQLAAYEASNVMNYASRGTSTSIADAISPFFNATKVAVSAHASKAFNIERQPAEYWASVAQVIGGGVALYMYILSQSEDDERNNIVPIDASESYVLNNFVIPMGVGENRKGEKAREMASINVDKVTQLYLLAARGIAEQIYYSGRMNADGTVPGRKRVKPTDFAKAFSETLPGVGSIAPTLSFISATFFNFDTFRMRAIYTGEKGIPADQMADERTKYLYRKIARFIPIPAAQLQAGVSKIIAENNPIANALYNAFAAFQPLGEGPTAKGEGELSSFFEPFAKRFIKTAERGREQMEFEREQAVAGTATKTMVSEIRQGINSNTYTSPDALASDLKACIESLERDGNNSSQISSTIRSLLREGIRSASKGTGVYNDKLNKFDEAVKAGDMNRVKVLIPALQDTYRTLSKEEDIQSFLSQLATYDENVSNMILEASQTLGDAIAEHKAARKASDVSSGVFNEYGDIVYDYEELNALFDLYSTQLKKSQSK